MEAPTRSKILSLLMRLRPPARFSLRAMLLAFTTVAVWLGWYANRVFEQRATVQLLRSRGAVVRYDFEESAGKRLAASSSVPAWLRDSMGVDWFHQVISADLNGSAHATEVSDDDLRRLSRLAGLKKLVLRDTSQVTAAGIEHLSRASALEDLYLHRPQITGVDLAPFRKLTNLAHLKLYVPVGDEGLAALSQAPALRDLGVPFEGVMTTGVRELRQHATSLQRLELSGFPYTGDPFQQEFLGLGPPSEFGHGQALVWTFP